MAALTADSFARLLARLDADPDRAGHEYERLRRALVRFFDWRGAASPEDCADEALDRLARRLDDVAIADLGGYARGIARLVLLERQREPVFAPLDDHRNPRLQAPLPAGGNRLHDCFDRCLDRFPPDNRSLIVAYYEGTGIRRIANRRRLAAALRVSDNGLRSRVQRLRDRLERCVRDCVAREIA